MAYDVIIRNGTIVDGTGERACVADIGVTNDRIERIGSLKEASSELVVDASGKYVLPGFIDPHSHADCSAFLYPGCESYLRQGITTFIGGQCGDANAPIYNWWMRKYWEYDMWNDIDPFVYTPRTVQPVGTVLDVVQKRTGFRIGWRSHREYADVLRGMGIGCNMIALAGHSQIRADVMGPDAMRPPTDEEMRRMKAHIEEAFSAGAWGYSTGRDYPPSAYAAFDEIRELAEYARDLGGYYFTHWRRTGPRVGTPGKPDKLAGIREALEIAIQTGIKTQISHLANGFEIYPENPQMDAYAAEITLRTIDEYLSRGADVSFDVIPGTSGGISTVPHLASMLMPWVKQSGSLAQFATNLRARDYRERLIAILLAGEWYAVNPVVNPSWDKKIYVTAGVTDWVGKNIRTIAEHHGKSAMETLMDMLIECPRVMIMRRDKSDEEVRGLLRHPRGYVCTDTYAFDLRGIYGNDGEFPEILPHPHTYCAFPKYLLTCPQESFELTVRKITGAPAEFFGILGRGVVREGGYADLVVLDRERLATNENYIEPRVYPQGIDYVFVNGCMAVGPEGCTSDRPGRILEK